MRVDVSPRPDLNAVQVYITDDDPSSNLFYDVLLTVEEAVAFGSQVDAAVLRVLHDPRRKIRD